MRRIWFVSLAFLLILSSFLMHLSADFQNLILDCALPFFLFYASFALIQILSLGGAESFRLACGRLTSVKKLKFSAVLSLIFSLLGGCILIGATLFAPPVKNYASQFKFDLIPIECAALVFALLRVCAVWFSARNQRKRKVCADILAPLGILALAVRRNGWIAFGIEILLLIVCLIWIFTDKTGWKACGTVLRSARVGILRAALYPFLSMLFFCLCGLRLFNSGSANLYMAFTLPISAMLFGDIALFESREYFRVDGNACARGLLFPAIAGFACFFAYWIADVAGRDFSAYMPAICIYILSAAVWGILYAPFRKMHLVFSLLCACFSFPLLYQINFPHAHLQAVVPLLFLLICIFGCGIIQNFRRECSLRRAGK